MPEFLMNNSLIILVSYQKMRLYLPGFGLATNHYYYTIYTE